MLCLQVKEETDNTLETVLKTTVWQLIDTSTVGGIETHVLHLSRSLQQYDIANQVVQVKRYGKHPVFDAVDNSDITMIHCNGIKDVIVRCLQYQPNVIHAHGAKACLIAKLLRVVSLQTVVCTYHTGETGVGLQGIYDRLNQWTAFIGQSIAVSDLIARKLKGACQRIDNFIPMPSRTLSRVNGVSYAFVGRLSHEKGPDRFVEIAKYHPQSSFSIFGQGPMLAAIKPELSSNVTLYTNVNCMNNYWIGIELLCITSREEGLPLVAIEAMARGICVVAFPVGGLPSLIQHNVNGFLLTSQSVVEFSDFIQHFKSLTTADKNRIGLNARNTIFNQYSTDAIVPQIVATYRDAEMEYAQ